MNQEGYSDPTAEWAITRAMKAQRQERKRQERMNYKSEKWKQKRKAIMRRDRYLCQHFVRYGRLVDAETVHHIFPVELYPEYEYCDWNLIALSNKAHNMMHDRDTHELTALGKKLQARVMNKRNEWDKTHPPR